MVTRLSKQSGRNYHEAVRATVDEGFRICAWTIKRRARRQEFTSIAFLKHDTDPTVLWMLIGTRRLQLPRSAYARATRRIYAYVFAALFAITGE